MFSRFARNVFQSKRLCSTLTNEQLKAIKDSLREELKQNQIQRSNAVFQGFQLGCVFLIAFFVPYGVLSFINDRRNLNRLRQKE